MLDGIIESKLKIIQNDMGAVMHAVKKSDKGFDIFGEMYFTTVKTNVIKAWKLHQRMTLNLIVPVGKVLFCFKDTRSESKTFNSTYKIVLSQQPYIRLTVPPRIWFGFKGLENGLNLVCNIANIIHDPAEVIRQDINTIDTDWNIK